MNIMTQLLLKKHIEERDKVLAENNELKKKYELEKRKSAY